jgi:hypothetical protein
VFHRLRYISNNIDDQKSEGKYTVLSENSGRSFGSYATEAKAEREIGGF